MLPLGQPRGEPNRSRDLILSQEVPASPPGHSVGLNVPAKADTENRKGVADKQLKPVIL